MTALRRQLDSMSTSVRVALAVAALAIVGCVTTMAVTTEDVTQHNGLSTSDPSHLRFFVDHRSDALVDAAKALTYLGNAPFLAGLALVALVVLWWRGTRLVVAVAPAASLAIAATAASVAKSVIGRARPPAAVRLVAETEPSFPSGHATDSTAFYLALALVVAVFVARRPLARAAVTMVGGAVALLVGLSRLVLGVHWPTDVLAGWALGAFAAVVVILLVSAVDRLTPPADDASVVRARAFALLHHRRPETRQTFGRLATVPVPTRANVTRGRR